MRSLLKFELYKIFSQKSIWITLIIIFLGLSAITLSSTSTSYGDSVEDTVAAWDKLEGDLSEERISKLKDELNKMDVENLSSPKEKAYGNTISNILFEDFEYSNFKERKAALEQEIQSLNNSNGTNYEELELKLSMLEKVDLNTTMFNLGPTNIIDNLETFFVIFTALLLIIGLSSVFSKETGTGMNQIILSSTHGRKKVTSAKLLAAVIYVLFIVGIQIIYNVGINTLLYTGQGWDSPLQKIMRFNESPYAFNLLEYFSTQMILHTLFSIGFAILIILISSLSKTSVQSIIISSIIFVIPLILYGFSITNFENYIRYGYIYLMTVDHFFVSFKTYNIFGTIILEPYVVTIVFVLVTVIFALLLYPIQKKRQVS
ncbi:ABC transporter permease [Chengkuizengella axinellae]|uniref:ABC transporter permease subunit n=1 Tax=Chengkuizengella axinellae TaxID=3064388 RepID=A0ABT9IXP1_9BACL|nr:ABC transporter permease [Chengkuizengella sp. 2205SS18-9]MDP5274136.1 ABC transporter permease subunit [Chengkuizengella sp. 2205SS18-9]